ncbi:hypothetical protein [Enterobacter ludwigii]|uniref:hypothetical protein n=1 Tax=Enterobacter ludwigii TaxID=299767 RepID=UPI003975BCB0
MMKAILAALMAVIPATRHRTSRVHNARAITAGTRPNEGVRMGHGQAPIAGPHGSNLLTHNLQGINPALQRAFGRRLSDAAVRETDK